MKYAEDDNMNELDEYMESNTRLAIEEQELKNKIDELKEEMDYIEAKIYISVKSDTEKMTEVMAQAKVKDYLRDSHEYNECKNKYYNILRQAASTRAAKENIEYAIKNIIYSKKKELIL